MRHTHVPIKPSDCAECVVLFDRTAAPRGTAATEYRHDVEYLVDQLRQYIDRTMQEGTDYMREHVGGRPALAERLKGYEDAMEDVQKMLRDPSHQFYRGLARYIHAARETVRGA